MVQYGPPKIAYAAVTNRQTVDNAKASTIDGWRYVPTEVVKEGTRTNANVEISPVDDGHVRFHLNLWNDGWHGRHSVTAQIAVYDNIILDPVMVFSVAAEFTQTVIKCIVVEKKYKDAIITIQMF